MVRVKMNTTSAGPGGTVQAGATIPVDETEAEDLVNGGYAVYVDPLPAPPEPTPDPDPAPAADSTPATEPAAPVQPAAQVAAQAKAIKAAATPKKTGR